MNNGNLLGDPTANIKKSFAALKLGAPQKDEKGKKQTLKISVTPFGSSGTTTTYDFKPKVTSTETKKSDARKSNTGIILKSMVKTDSLDELDKVDYDVNISSEKSLLEEISETLQRNHSLSNKILEPEKAGKNDVIKVEIKNPTVIASAVISSGQDEGASQDANLYDTPKKSTSILAGKNTPEKNGTSIEPSTSDTPKISTSSINLTSKSVTQSNPTSNPSQNSMKRAITRNNPIKKDQNKPTIQKVANTPESDLGSDQENLESEYYDVVETRNSYENIPDGVELQKPDGPEKADKKGDENLLTKKSHFFSNQLISDMFMSHKKVTDQIKKRAESYNLSDGSYSKITADGLIVTQSQSHEDALDSTGSSFDSSSSSDEEMNVNKSESDSGIGIRVTGGSTLKIGGDKNSASAINSNNSSDYEDIQVPSDLKGKSRELEGEPDGRSDPDGSSEVNAPALPSSPPPAHDPRPSFLHTTPKPYVPPIQSPDKPKVPAKPALVKFGQKRTPVQNEVIKQLQQVIVNPNGQDLKESKEKSPSLDSLEIVKPLKKTRAPNPPEETGEKEIIQTTNTSVVLKHKNNTVSQVKERHYPSINPKFRSLNNLHNKDKDKEKEKEELVKPSTPEPAPRHSLSLSQDSLNMDTVDKKKKNKFSIKKFLRMGSKSDVSKYADIPTYNDSPNSPDAPQVRPRLVIIHPLDINQSGVSFFFIEFLSHFLVNIYPIFQ
jgi:hypothetical protein